MRFEVSLLETRGDERRSGHRNSRRREQGEKGQIGVAYLSIGSPRGRDAQLRASVIAGNAPSTWRSSVVRSVRSRLHFVRFRWAVKSAHSRA
jgi:hypothetical protein